MNRYYNTDANEEPLKGGKGRSFDSGGSYSMPFKEKPGFPKAALPGKTQPKDRSGGVKRAKVRPDGKGL